MSTKETLNKMRLRFKEIVDSDTKQDFKDIRFGSLMTDMERMFDIPTISVKRKVAFERKYPEVMGFYQQVSQERKF